VSWLTAPPQCSKDWRDELSLGDRQEGVRLNSVVGLVGTVPRNPTCGTVDGMFDL